MTACRWRAKLTPRLAWLTQADTATAAPTAAPTVTKAPAATPTAADRHLHAGAKPDACSADAHARGDRHRSGDRNHSGDRYPKALVAVTAARRQRAAPANRRGSLIVVVSGAGAELFDMPDGTKVQDLPMAATVTAALRNVAGDWVFVTASDGASGWTPAAGLVAFGLERLPALDVTADNAADSAADSAADVAADDAAAGRRGRCGGGTTA